jgi:hypothetical protein
MEMDILIVQTHGAGPNNVSLFPSTHVKLRSPPDPVSGSANAAGVDTNLICLFWRTYVR